jgi:zinc/manganese transport system substrate-binding protein
MKKLFLSLLTLAAVVCAQASYANIKIFACEPEWGALSKELAGDKASIYTATNAFQDPHHIQARPSLIAAVRDANLIVCTGAELEIGWLPILLLQSGNPAIQTGKPGSFAAADYVHKLEVPTVLDRSEGDVHPGGNPHIQTDPRNIALVADALATRLAQLDPANAPYYQARHKDFATRWQKAIQNWQKLAAPLRGQAIVVQHKGWAYLESWLGLREVATLEPKPGVDPTSTHLAEVEAQLQRQPARMILRAAYNGDRAHDLFGLFDDTIESMLKALK